MKDFLIYFLGEGETEEFAIFTLAHLMPILFGVAVILLIRHFRERIAACKSESTFRYVLAFILILSDMTYYWRLVAMPELGPNPIDNLPVSVCGWAVIMSSYMVIGKNKTLFDIAYFWLFSGSLFALLTPTVLNYTGPTRFRYYQFWTEHIFGYIALFYMIFVHKMRPTIRSAIKSYIALAVLAIIAYGVNQMVPGANYLFIAHPEAAPSVLDILPPNFALRILIMAGVITLMYFAAYLPWLIKDKKANKAVLSC